MATSALYTVESSYTSYATALLFPTALPYYLSLLPAIFRFFAFLVILPVLLLAGGDLIGWTVFKFVLRPLGYASTIRFKDPDPPTNLISISNNLSPSTAITALKKRRSSQYLDLTGIRDSLVLTKEEEEHGRDGDSPSPVSYTSTVASSPVFASTPLSLSIELEGERIHSREGSIESTQSIERHRASSIGVDGPLFGLEGCTSPNQSDDRVLPPLDSEAGLPKGGAKFGMTKVDQ